MIRRYFGGAKVQPATVFQLRPQSFPQLIAEKFDIPVRLDVTYDEYQDLSDDEKFKVKNGPYMLAVSMKDGETHRCDVNADTLEAAFLDVDDPVQARYICESPDQLLEDLYPWNGVIYKTLSHTDAAPRVRVMLDVQAPVTRHKDVIALMVERIGLPSDFKGAQESNVLSQPFFLPATFRGSTESPILASRTNGRTLTETDIPVRAVTESSRTYAYDGDGSSDLSFLPVQDLTVEDIREPLFAIDADLSRGPWVMIASALRHQFRDEEQAHEAYLLFDEWSQTGSKYKNEEDTWARWKSLRPDTIGKNPRTIRSLFHLAQSTGWQPTKVATKMRLSIGEWIDSRTKENAETLLSEGVKMIADLPFKSATTEEMLKDQLIRQYKKLTGKKPSMKSISRDVSDARFKAKQDATADDKPKWLRPWCYVTTDNLFRNVLTGEKLIPAAFNYTFSSDLMPSDGELAKTGKPTMLPTDFSLNVQKIKKVGGVTYDPRRTATSDIEPYFMHNGIEYLNEYRASSIPKLDPANAAKVGKYFVKHLRTLIKEKDYADIILYYCAFLVQYPGEKLGWCPVIQSSQGGGKGLLGEMMSAALGADNVKIANPSTMKQTWNDWAFGCQLCILEEMKVVGHARAEIMNAIKDVMTNEKVTVNRRNTDSKADLNLVNFIGFTNYADALFLEEDDRRYMFIRSALDTKSKIEALNAADYFTPLGKIVKDGGGALRSFLLSVEIPEDFPRKGPAPFTIYRADAIAESKHKTQLDIEDLVDGDVATIGADVIHYNDLAAHITMPKESKPLSHYLQLMNYTRFDGGNRHDINGTRTTIWTHRDNYDPIFGTADELLRERISENI